MKNTEKQSEHSETEQPEKVVTPPKAKRETPLDQTLNEFVKTNTKQKVAVIVPLFGYWDDTPSQQLTGDVLKVVMDRIHSDISQLYMLYVAEPQRLGMDASNYLVGKSLAGNMQGVKVEMGASYGDYIRAGIETALEATDASYILVVNPWVIIQHGGVDALVERINRGDTARIIAGFDLRNIIEAESFDAWKAQVAKEERDLNFNFVGMARYTAEMLALDEDFKTHQYIERDTWQAMFAKGYEVITTQLVPIFSFDLAWDELEAQELVAADKGYFIKKWNFDPGIK